VLYAIEQSASLPGSGCSLCEKSDPVPKKPLDHSVCRLNRNELLRKKMAELDCPELFMKYTTELGKTLMQENKLFDKEWDIIDLITKVETGIMLRSMDFTSISVWRDFMQFQEKLSSKLTRHTLWEYE